MGRKGSLVVAICVYNLGSGGPKGHCVVEDDLELPLYILGAGITSINCHICLCDAGDQTWGFVLARQISC